MRLSTVALLGALAWQMVAASAFAQLEEDLIPASHKFESPENFAVEFRLGPYHPNHTGGNGAFDTYFSSDNGPLLATELDVIAWRVPKALYLGVGGGIGRMNFTGDAIVFKGGTTTKAREKTSIEMIPLNALGVLRIDALARRLSVPFILTGKVGYQWMHWSTDRGGRTDATGWSLGLLWGAQLEFDLDFFEPAAARALDEEWGINHSFLFFELRDFSPTQKSLPIGALSWAAGLGFMF